MLSPKLAILDETDSGLDVDAVRTVSKGIEEYQKRMNGALIIITHSTKILESLHVDKTACQGVAGRRHRPQTPNVGAGEIACRDC